MDLPVEIDYQIIKNLHPYYVSELYCGLNKRSINVCLSSKYELLQIWVYPEKSLNSLRSEFPNLTFNDLLNLCLFYNPIPESIKYYDGYSLFYQACMKNQVDPFLYIKSSRKVDWNTIFWICYKFNRIDVLNSFPSYIYNFGLMKAVLHIKLGINESGYFSKTSPNLLKPLWKGFMFSAEETIQIIIILSVATKKINPVYQSPYQFLLTGYDQPYLSDEDQLNISTYRSLLSYEQLVSIISKYYPDDKPTEIWTHPINKKLLGTDETLTISKLWHNDEEISKLAIPCKGIYYISSGDIASYVKWKENKRKLPVLYHKNLSCNIFGLVTFNKDLLDNTNLEILESNVEVSLMNAAVEFKKYRESLYKC